MALLKVNITLTVLIKQPAVACAKWSTSMLFAYNH